MSKYRLDQAKLSTKVFTPSERIIPLDEVSIHFMVCTAIEVELYE
jgi:hypothetical protein